MNKKTNPGLKIICLNRKASFNYFFEDLFEAGIVLKGSEIKSIRDGKVNIADSYAIEKKGEIVLINSHISPFKQASYSNHNPTDDRKLLLNKKEINKLNRESLEPIVEELIKSNETNFKGVGQPLRIALIGSKFGPGIYDIIISLGKTDVEKRLTNKTIS